MVSVVAKSRLGFSIAIVTVIAIGGSETLRRVSATERSVAIVCVIIAVAGLFSWLKGRHRAQEAPAMASNDDLASERGPDDVAPPFLKQYTHWGVILTLSAGLLYFMSTLLSAKPKPPLAPGPPPKRKVVVEPAVVEPVVTFPALKLQGINFNGAHSLALINGTTLAIGERVDQVRLVSVSPDKATVEMGGETNLLILQK